MHSKILSKRELVIVSIIGLIPLTVFLLNFISPGPIQNKASLFGENTITLLQQSRVRSGLPVRLKIPGININTALEFVGLTPDGAMDIPKSQDAVAWFELGPRPGETGSAVIAGHYGWQNNKASAFDYLHKLRPGDKLYIVDDKGAIISFVVRESRSYDPNADTAAVFDSNDEKSHLNLITCEGVWNKISQSYPKRLVVFTDKETNQ